MRKSRWLSGDPGLRRARHVVPPSDSSSPLSAGPPHPSASARRSQGICLSLCERQGPGLSDWASKPGGLPPAAAPPRGTQAPRRGRTLFRGEEGVLRRTGTPYTLGLRPPCQALSSLKNSVFRTVLASQQSGGRFRGLPTALPAPTRPARRPRPHGHAAVTQSPQLASGSRSLSRTREFGQRSSDTRPPLWRHTEYPAAPKTPCAPPVHPGPAPAPGGCCSSSRPAALPFPGRRAAGIPRAAFPDGPLQPPPRLSAADGSPLFSAE